MNIDEFSWIFRYTYGFSTKEKIVFLEKNFDWEARRFTRPGISTRRAWYHLHHEKRLLRAGREQPSFADQISNLSIKSPFLALLPKDQDFAGSEIRFGLIAKSPAPVNTNPHFIGYDWK